MRRPPASVLARAIAGDGTAGDALDPSPLRKPLQRPSRPRVRRDRPSQPSWAPVRASIHGHLHARDPARPGPGYARDPRSPSQRCLPRDVDARLRPHFGDIGPAALGPVAAVRNVYEANLLDPLGVHHPVPGRDTEATRETMLLAKQLPLMPDRQQCARLERPCERDGDVVSVRAAKHHLHRRRTGLRPPQHVAQTHARPT